MCCSNRRSDSGPSRRRATRRSAAEVTIYQSCGIAVQDVAAAQLVYDRARSLGIGIDVEL